MNSPTISDVERQARTVKRSDAKLIAEAAAECAEKACQWRARALAAEEALRKFASEIYQGQNDTSAETRADSVYVQWSDNGRFVRKWDWKPFEGAEQIFGIDSLIATGLQRYAKESQRDSVIEECAKVADAKYKSYLEPASKRIARDIASAIRALRGTTNG